MGVWKLKGVRRSNGQWICPIFNKEGNWSHILRCDGTKFRGTKFWTRGLGILMEKYLLGGN
jgi:hypothetical protein